MGDVYVVTYLTPTSDMIRKISKSATHGIVGEFCHAMTTAGWPYDGGDDPSFFTWQRLRQGGGKLAWGVCRTDLRRLIQPADTVVFFAYERRPATHAAWARGTYLFVGYATAQVKVSPEDIWTEPLLELYRPYLNHLIQRKGDEYVHLELVPGQRHPDWLWRIADVRGWGKDHWKKKFETEGTSGKFVPGETAIGERPVVLGKAYVLFEPDPPQTYVLSNPIAVAQYKGLPEQFERWFPGDLAQAIKDRCLPEPRHLRTKNSQ